MSVNPSFFRQALVALARVILRDPECLRVGASFEEWEREARAEGYPSIDEAYRAFVAERLPSLERAGLEEAMGSLQAGMVIEEMGPDDALAWRITPELEGDDLANLGDDRAREGGK